MTSRGRSPDVFVNVPFDDPYQPLFEALLFTVSACGYRVRCALEDDDSGNIRLDKLVELIRESPRSIHDLSRIERGSNDLPRFNMPFELGLALGAKRFGRRPGDRIKIMVAEPYRLPAYLSDLGGNDPSAHRNDPSQLIRIVRDFLDRTPTGGMLPGPSKLLADFEKFKVQLPKVAREIHHQPEEIRGFGNYRTFLWCVTEILKKADRIEWPAPTGASTPRRGRQR
ncbi:MAG TPA: hypothetical protein VKF35_16010 [Hyphomicrobiaceae bacterium]|nr:hypothetical protein [Hyphomicrobiaceae bacterium]